MNLFRGLLIVMTLITSQTEGQSAERMTATAEPPQLSLYADSSGDELIKQIETRLKTVRRQLSFNEFTQTHREIASLIAQLQLAYPNDSRVAAHLPKRWHSLTILTNHGNPEGRRELFEELADTIGTTTRPRLKQDALFWQALLHMNGPVDGPKAATLARKFAIESPNDDRAGELYHIASQKLDVAIFTRTVFCGLLIVVCCWLALPVCTNVPGRRKAIFYGGLLAVGSFLVFASLHLYLDSSSIFLQFPLLRYAAYQFFAYLPSLSQSLRPWIALGLAIAFGATLVVRRPARPAFLSKMQSVHLATFGFFGAIAFMCVTDIALCAIEKAQMQRAIAQLGPSSFRGQLVQGENRQREQIGQLFELDFRDAISGAEISMRQFRGKLVVVDFWATSCGPCIAEIPEMRRLYEQFHDQGVEFIGVSRDNAEEDGGLTDLRNFVAKERIPWPQYHDPLDPEGILSGKTSGSFAESWGVAAIPTVFLIDADGMLLSTNARGQLDTLIPKLLKAGKVKPR